MKIDKVTFCGDEATLHYTLADNEYDIDDNEMDTSPLLKVEKLLYNYGYKYSDDSDYFQTITYIKEG